MRLLLWLGYFPSDISDAIQLHDTESCIEIEDVPPSTTVRGFFSHYGINSFTTKLAWWYPEHSARQRRIEFAHLDDRLDALGELVCCVLVRRRVR